MTAFSAGGFARFGIGIRKKTAFAAVDTVATEATVKTFNSADDLDIAFLPLSYKH
jgi:hypothetical protein